MLPYDEQPGRRGPRPARPGRPLADRGALGGPAPAPAPAHARGARRERRHARDRRRRSGRPTTTASTRRAPSRRRTRRSRPAASTSSRTPSCRPASGRGPFVAQLGARLDTFYPDDPDGLNVGNVSVFLRNEEAHVGAVGRVAEVRLGTFARQWGVAVRHGRLRLGQPAALRRALGPHRRRAHRGPLVHGRARRGDGRRRGSRAAPATARATRRCGASSPATASTGGPAPWLVVAGIETMLYSGANASLSLPALLPTAVLSFLNDGAPRNAENNGIVGGLLWLQRGRATVDGPARVRRLRPLQRPRAAVDRAHRARPSSPGWATPSTSGVDLTVVTARAYRSALPEQVYTYALRSLGAPASDLVDVRLFADASLERVLPGLTVGPELRSVQQGEGDFVTPYPANGAPTLGIGDAHADAPRRPPRRLHDAVGLRARQPRRQPDDQRRVRPRRRPDARRRARRGGARIRLAAPVPLGW